MVGLNRLKTDSGSPFDLALGSSRRKCSELPSTAAVEFQCVLLMRGRDDVSIADRV